MDQIPSTEQQVSLGEHHKSPVVPIFIGIALITIVAISYWIMRQQSRIQTPESGTTSLTVPQAADDTSSAINADFNAINVDETNLDTEFKDIDKDLQAL